MDSPTSQDGVTVSIAMKDDSRLDILEFLETLEDDIARDVDSYRAVVDFDPMMSAEEREISTHLMDSLERVCNRLGEYRASMTANPSAYASGKSRRQQANSVPRTDSGVQIVQISPSSNESGSPPFRFSVPTVIEPLLTRRQSKSKRSPQSINVAQAVPSVGRSRKVDSWKGFMDEDGDGESPIDRYMPRIQSASPSSIYSPWAANPFIDDHPSSTVSIDDYYSMNVPVFSFEAPDEVIESPEDPEPESPLEDVPLPPPKLTLEVMHKSPRRTRSTENLLRTPGTSKDLPVSPRTHVRSPSDPEIETRRLSISALMEQTAPVTPSKALDVPGTRSKQPNTPRSASLPKGEKSPMVAMFKSLDVPPLRIAPKSPRSASLPSKPEKSPLAAMFKSIIQPTPSVAHQRSVSTHHRMKSTDKGLRAPKSHGRSVSIDHRASSSSSALKPPKSHKRSVSTHVTDNLDKALPAPPPSTSPEKTAPASGMDTSTPPLELAPKSKPLRRHPTLPMNPSPHRNKKHGSQSSHGLHTSHSPHNTHGSHSPHATHSPRTPHTHKAHHSHHKSHNSTSLRVLSVPEPMSPAPSSPLPPLPRTGGHDAFTPTGEMTLPPPPPPPPSAATPSTTPAPLPKTPLKTPSLIKVKPPGMRAMEKEAAMLQEKYRSEQSQMI